MTYPPQDYLIILRPKGNRLEKICDPLDCLAAMTAYIFPIREKKGADTQHDRLLPEVH